jgi:eukaryotic-like serine/threonine-protein kinase
MGVVWRAHDVVLGREVAVKEVVFPPTMAAEERRAAQARVLREARAAARLNHPGAVTLYDVVQDQGGTFIVMELVGAPTLAELVAAQGPLPPGRVAELGVQLAGALEAAHAAGIVHRDVKPANVMVAAGGGAKLADFGVASLQGDPQLTSTGLVLGSPAYMAPEQARGEQSGPAADFWALGATLFYAVEGVAPFDRGSSVATLAAVVNDPPRAARRAGPLAEVIGALLDKDPTARPSGPKVRAWLSWLLAVTPVSPPTTALPPKRPGRVGPRRPAALGPGPMATPASGPVAANADRSQRSEEVPAFEPVQRQARPILPPAPPVPGRARRRLLGVVVLLLIVGVLTARLIGAFESGPTGVRVATATTGEPARVDPGEERAASAIRRNGASATSTTQPTPSTTKEPPATRAPTTPTTAAAQRGLPAGWRSFTNRSGANRVGVPPGFRARTRQRYHATVIEEQDGARRVFTVRSQSPSAPLPQASRDYRAWARRNFAGFREVRYAENQTYAGHGAAVVFEYEAVRDGRRVHVSHINVKGRTWGYNVELIVPAAQWDATRTLARQFEQAFQPLG